MRFLILNTDYAPFIQWLYTQRPKLEKASYAEQMKARVESLFGVADFYSSNLRNLGHEAWEIHANNEFMQRAWAKEHGLKTGVATAQRQGNSTLLRWARRLAARTPLRYAKPVLRPMVRAATHQHTWFYDILASQIRQYRPDVLLNQSLDGIECQFLATMKSYVRLLVGQHGSPLPSDTSLGCYELLISLLPSYVDYFRRMGLHSELHRLGFEPRVLAKLGSGTKNIPVSFVGSLSSNQVARTQLVVYLAKQIALGVWGQGVDRLPEGSAARLNHRGPAWGAEMYQILCNSKITLNSHGEIAGPYAANMRLFEATVVGTFLLTDWKPNLHDMFEPGKEVVTYRSPEECAELIAYYLTHDNEREAIARAGQARTLREHTYHHRMQDFVQTVQKYI